MTARSSILVAHPGCDSLPVAWWQLPIVWLALGLPGLVVVAGVFVAVLAWRHVDPVVVDLRAPAAGVATEATAGAAAGALEPALTARNHAATPRR